MSNRGHEWFNQIFILEVRKMTVMIKLLQSIIWACYCTLMIFPSGIHSSHPDSYQHDPYCLNATSFIFREIHKHVCLQFCFFCYVLNKV